MGKCCGGQTPAEAAAMASIVGFKPRDGSDGVVYKSVIAGEAGVGKTSLVERLLGFPWDPNATPTVGIDFKHRTEKIGNMSVKLQLWDSAGQERFRSLTNTYFRNVHLVIFVYDVTNPETFDKLNDYWVRNAVENAQTDNFLKVLIGNKTDLLQPGQPEPVEPTKTDALSRLEGWMYFRTSAKRQKSEQIEEIRKQILDRLLQRDPDIDFEALMREDSVIKCEKAAKAATDPWLANDSSENQVD